jgi:Hemerythrin HHE cation binding domain
MPDVFEVLKKDHDEVKAMLDRLSDGPTAATGATGEQLAQRKRRVDNLIMEESRHEAAEQQYFWPAMRQFGPEGGRIADQAIEQETAGEETLNKLDALDPNDQRFESVLASFASDARAHIAFEEAHAWPLLSATLSQQESAELAEKIIQAKKLAPTRPHPKVPPQPGALKTVGPLASMADKIRDVLTGRGRHA